MAKMKAGDVKEFGKHYRLRLDPDGTFTAVTPSQSKDFKSEKGALRWLKRKGAPMNESEKMHEDYHARMRGMARAQEESVAQDPLHSFRVLSGVRSTHLSLAEARSGLTEHERRQMREGANMDLVKLVHKLLGPFGRFITPQKDPGAPYLYGRRHGVQVTLVHDNGELIATIEDDSNHELANRVFKATEKGASQAASWLKHEYSKAARKGESIELDEKKPPLGSGERFKKLTKKLKKRGAKDPKALAAYIGRKKYGKKKFQKLSQHEDAEPMDEAYLRRPPRTVVFSSAEEMKAAVADARFRMSAIRNFLDGGASKKVLEPEDVRKFERLIGHAQDDLMEIERELDQY